MREDQDRPGRGEDGGDWFAANAPPGNGQPAPPGTHRDPASGAIIPDTAAPGTHSDPNTGATIYDTPTTIDSAQPIWGQAGITSPYAAPAPAPAAPSSSGPYQGGPPAGFGVPPAPYQSSGNAPTYQAPAQPAVLQSPYVAPVWSGGDFVAPTKPAEIATPFHAPTQAELEASPGYQARLTADQQARERSAAARGTLLSGGTQVALGHAAQDYASNEYGNLFGQSLSTRQQNVGEFNTSFTDAFSAYLQRYKTFSDASNASLSAREQNAGEFNQSVNRAQQDYTNQYTAYQNENARTLNDYLTNFGVKRTSENDLWSRQNDVANRGLSAALGSRVS